MINSLISDSQSLLNFTIKLLDVNAEYKTISRDLRNIRDDLDKGQFRDYSKLFTYYSERGIKIKHEAIIRYLRIINSHLKYLNDCLMIDDNFSNEERENTIVQLFNINDFLECLIK